MARVVGPSGATNSARASGASARGRNSALAKSTRLVDPPARREHLARAAASSTASAASSPAGTSSTRGLPQREGLQRGDGEEREARALGQGPRRGDPDAKSGERPRARDRPRSGRPPSSRLRRDSRTRATSGQQVRGVAGRSPGADRAGSEHHVANAGERAPRGRRCSVEGAGSSRASIAASSLSGASGVSIVTVRCPRPACSMSTRAATCAEPGDARHRATGPLDERDPVGTDVVGEEIGVLVGQVRHPVQIEVGDRDAARVALANREGRAGHAALDAERPAGAAHERGLARADSPSTSTASPGVRLAASSAASASVCWSCSRLVRVLENSCSAG